MPAWIFLRKGCRAILALSYSQPDRLNPNHSPLHTTAICAEGYPIAVSPG